MKSFLLPAKAAITGFALLATLLTGCGLLGTTWTVTVAESTANAASMPILTVPVGR